MFDINTIIASIGLIMATVSFMTGLQLAKRDKSVSIMMAGMHRINGYITCTVYIAIAALSLNGNGGFRTWSVIGWAVGLGLIAIKIFVIRNERYYKYGSRVGLMLFVTWLIIIYKHIVA